MVSPNHLLGEVTINDNPTKSKLFRFCEKKIDQWLQARRDETHSSESAGEMPAAEFRVSFSEEDESRQVSCVTEIQLGDEVWRGCELANDTQQAFIHSLKRLQPH